MQRQFNLGAIPICFNEQLKNDLKSFERVIKKGARGPISITELYRETMASIFNFQMLDNWWE